MSVTAAQGFSAAGIAAGIKAEGSPDPALVMDGGPSRATARVVTSGRVKAAPVAWCERVVTDGALRADVLNSGGATMPVTLPRDDTAPPFSSRASHVVITAVLAAGDDAAAVRANDPTRAHSA